MLGHRGSHAVCLKATTQVDVYLKNPEMMVGCVYYEAGELNLFSQATVIQPDNQIPIEHDHIKRCKEDGALEIMGTMPATFSEALLKAIDNSTTMSERKKGRIRQLIPRFTDDGH